MERRRFIEVIAGGFVAAPLAAEAQQARKVYRIGMLETRSPELNAANVDAFRQGLWELGYKEGQNLEIVYRSSDGRDERFPGLAGELVRLKVDLILTRGTPAALAAKSATGTIPVGHGGKWRSCRIRHRQEPRLAGRERHRAKQRNNRILSETGAIAW